MDADISRDEETADAVRLLRSFLPGGADGPADDEPWALDENAPSAWPFYVALLDTASPREVDHIGWQVITYYVLWGQEDWPQGGKEIVRDVANSATRSPRLGRFLSHWLLFHWSAAAPDAAATTVKMLDARYGWQLARNIDQIRAGLGSAPSCAAGPALLSDFSSRSVRSSVVDCYSATPLSPSSADDVQAREHLASVLEEASPALQGVFLGAITALLREGAERRGPTT